MSAVLITSITAITLALILYTIGVWAEHRARILKWSHFVFFVLGFAADTTGTLAMSKMANKSAEASGSAIISLHGITGALAIGLMFIHVIWALIVLIKGSDKAKAQFHKFSLIVWGSWLIPYFIGMFMGMR